MRHQGCGQGDGSGQSGRGPGMVHSSEAAVSSEVQTSTREGLAEMTCWQAEHAGRQAEWQPADSYGSLPLSGMETRGAASTATLQLESSADHQSALVYSLDIGASSAQSRAESHQQNSGSLHVPFQASDTDAEWRPAAAQDPLDTLQPQEVHGSSDPTDEYSSVREHALPEISDDSAASQAPSAGSAPVSTAQHSAAASRPSAARSNELRSSAGSTSSQHVRQIASQTASHDGSAPRSDAESPHSSGLSGNADVPDRQVQALPYASIPQYPRLSGTFKLSNAVRVLYTMRRNNAVNFYVVSCITRAPPVAGALLQEWAI